MSSLDAARAARKGRSHTVLHDGPRDIDVHVGRRLRMRRTLVGLSQTELADRLGLSFQQIQKYERGHNRISASRLWSFAEVLQVHVGWFFEGLEGDSKAPHNEAIKRETLQLMRYFHACPKAIQKHLLELFKALAK